MKLATWNVNSLRARLPRVCAWLAREAPDVVCLQETKVTDDLFPLAELDAAGYTAAVHGQKTYNGVAILARAPLADIVRGFADGAPDDPAARLIAASVAGVRVISAYIPNGSEVPSDKYTYKQAWLARLLAQLRGTADPTAPLVLCGDFNIVHREIDAARPAAWYGGPLYNEFLTGWMDDVAAWGLSDLFRAAHPDEAAFSWWDYRAAAFRRNDGLRIDYLLATVPMAAACQSVRIDHDERKGDGPSDHAPVIAEFDWPPPA